MIILFTDIDGTITNKYTHAFEGSDIWLKKLNNLGIRVIFNSSKTFSEIINLQKILKINQPFIFENGSAIAIPVDQLKTLHNVPSGRNYKKNLIYSLVPKDLNVLLWSDQINKLYPGKFFTLQSGNSMQLQQITGLTENALKLAQQRLFTETYFFSDNKISLKFINEKLTSLNAIAVQGSRFVTVSHNTASKGNAIRKYLGLLQNDQIKLTTYSVGDGQNDYSMFAETDHSYFLTNEKSVNLKLENTGIINPEGPLGFKNICMRIIKDREGQSIN